MSYYQCKRCNYIAKQKNDMRKHLSKLYKCKIPFGLPKPNKTDIELDQESLTKIYINDISDNEINKNNTNNNTNDTNNVNINDNNNSKCNYYTCLNCNNLLHNKSNLNRHMKTLKCKSSKINDKEHITIGNNNIGVQNNIYIINNLRGFDQEWNLSNINQDTKEKLLLSDKKFTNTLNNILQNKDNCNVYIKNEHTGYVYLDRKKEYEARKIDEICDEAMDKLYKNLRDFFKETMSNNINDLKVDILEKEMSEIDNKYVLYKNSLKTNRFVNSCISNVLKHNNDKALNNIILNDNNKRLDLALKNDLDSNIEIDKDY